MAEEYGIDVASGHVARLPTREGLPKALIEAAACGLPIVAVDAIGCQEVVRNRDNGLLVPVGDTQVLANALRTLIFDADLRTQMGKQSRARAEREFSCERFANAEIIKKCDSVGLEAYGSLSR